MIQYIYIVKCPNCEDEHFDFFTDAKEYAVSCLNNNPVITQVEVDRNDFGECTGSADLGTVWSWEDMMAEKPGAFETKFSKDDLVFDNDDDEFDDDIQLLHSSVTPTISQLVEMMEENEDNVECRSCEELFSKAACSKDPEFGWLCEKCFKTIYTDNPITTSLQESTPSWSDEVEFEYDDLTATVVTGSIPATQEEPEEYEEGEYTGYYCYKVDTDKVAEVLLTKIMPSNEVDALGGVELLDDENAYDNFLDNNFDDLLDKYLDQLLEYFREEAEEAASNSEEFQDEYNQAMEAEEERNLELRYEEARDRERYGDDYY